MELDKYLDQIQEDQIQELEPVTTAVLYVGTKLLILNFVMFLLMSYSLKKSMKVDKKLTTKINKILKESKWVVHIVPDKSPNAFAIGGNHIFITTGLKKILTEREVEGVLLHEVYHNRDLHIYKKMAYDYPLFYLMVAGAAFITVSTGGNFLLGFLSFILMTKVAKIPYAIIVGRRHERKADEYAVQFGYGKELVNALKKLEKQYLKLMAKKECGKICQLSEKIGEAIDEHPPTKKRIEYILKKADKLKQVLKTMSFKKIRDFVLKG